MTTPKPTEAAEELAFRINADKSKLSEIQAALEAQRSAPPADSRKASQSLTIRAAIANAAMPILALKIAQWSGMEAEQAWELAASIFVMLSSLMAIGMRRAIGALLVAIALSSVGCCSKAEKRLETVLKAGHRFADGPGDEWVEQAASGEARAIRADRVEAFRLVLEAAAPDQEKE